MLLHVADLVDKDELLGSAVTEGLIAESEEYLAHEAERVGVLKEDIKPTYYVKQFLTAHVFREICKRRSFGAPPATWGGEGKDSYASKFSFYRDEMRKLELSLSAENLTGEKGRGGYGSVAIYRG